MEKLKVCELFGGIGGFSLGIQRALGKENVEVIYYNDFDRYSVRVYNRQFRTKWKAKDITKVKAEELPDFDILCGGFPCQAFSVAGKRKGFDDTRGTLFFEIARIIKAKRPPYFLLENVKGILNHEEGKTFRVIIETIWSLGYDVQWILCNSKFFGVPQNRERVFFIGNIAGERRPEILPFKEDAGEVPRISREEKVIYDRKGFDSRTKGFRESKISPTLSTKMGTGGNNVPMINDGVARCLTARDYKGPPSPEYHFDKGVYNIVALRQRDRHGKNEEKIQQFEERKDNCSNTITSIDKDNYVITDKLRRLTPVECERLQSFPDYWTAISSDSQRYKQLGNAVTVNVIAAIIGRMFKGVYDGNK